MGCRFLIHLKFIIQIVSLERGFGVLGHLDLQILSLGDCGFPVCFAWIDAFTPVLGLDLDWPDNLREYRGAIEAHTAVASELDAYAPGMQRWLESKAV